MVLESVVMNVIKALILQLERATDKNEVKRIESEIKRVRELKKLVLSNKEV